MNIARVWAMPSSDTFDCPPIGAMVKRYLMNSKVSIDPFARNKRWATYTNDLNPETAAEYHMYALDFLKMLAGQGIKADLVIFDPPYSLRQVQECYQEHGAWTFSDTQNAVKWTDEKEICYELLSPGGYFLHFGWHTNGMGKKRDMLIEEILLVCHGPGHHDTICMAERKLSHQPALLELQ